ncbi:hypothetical protein CMI37_07665 [Candidatus Pacearchaeota archaeon]|nr:hypothetical protein [Candidatus Pacearchaeota archaeon]
MKGSAPSFSGLEATETLELPPSFLPFAPINYRFPPGARPLVLFGGVRSLRTGEPIGSIVELWHQVELEPDRWGFAQGRWAEPTDWRGRLRAPVQGTFAFVLAHPGSDGVVRPVFARISAPGYRTLVTNVEAEPWSDRTSLDVVLEPEPPST